MKKTKKQNNQVNLVKKKKRKKSKDRNEKGKIKFQHENFSSLRDKIKNKEFGDKVIFNFLNSNDMYNIKKNSEFKKSLENQKDVKNVNFIDGFINTAVLSFKNMKKINRMRGPSFTHEFLSDKELSKNKKHFFIGKEKDEVKKLAEKYNLNKKKVYAYNPPYIKGTKFPGKEIERIAREINKVRPDYVWIGVGSPKQNILAFDLFDKVKTKYIFKFNVGAGLDFALGKKKEAPRYIQEAGLEWFYRLVTDFKHSKKKVWRSLLGSWYALGLVDLDENKAKKSEN